MSFTRLDAPLVNQDLSGVYSGQGVPGQRCHRGFPSLDARP